MVREEEMAKDIGKKIRDWREEKGVTQRTVMIRTGLAQKTISRIENGIDNPRLSTLLKMADAIGLSMELVLTNKMDDPIKEPQKDREEIG